MVFLPEARRRWPVPVPMLYGRRGAGDDVLYGGWGGLVYVAGVTRFMGLWCGAVVE